MRRFLSLWIVFLLMIGAGAAIRYEWIVVPAQWSPWAPLDLDAAPNFLTRYKLSRLTGDDALCRQMLQRAAVEFDPVPDRVTGANCEFKNAVLIRRTSADVKTGYQQSGHRRRQSLQGIRRPCHSYSAWNVLYSRCHRTLPRIAR